MKKRDKFTMKILSIILIIAILLAIILLLTSIYNIIQNEKVEVPEVAVMKTMEYEYEEEILPDGLYFYHADGAYLTAGIQTIGTMNGARACQVTFYGTSEYGKNISTYEDIIVQSEDNKYLFEGALKDSCYNIQFNEWGTINVIQTKETDTPLSFENLYIYLYSFEELNY